MQSIKQSKKAFTIIELIVAVIIIAILSTIGFIYYSNYIIDVRDTNRINQLSNIYNGLELYRVKRDLPIPEDKTDIEANGKLIAYQWYMGKSNLGTIEYNKEWKDPKDDVYFSYYLTKNQKYFQLITFLENENILINGKALNSNPLISQTYASIDYSNRYPYVVGKNSEFLLMSQILLYRKKRYQSLIS